MPPDVHAVAELVQDNWPCARPFDIGGDNSALRGNAAQGFDGWGRQESGCLRRSPVGNRHLHAADAVDSSELLHVPA